MMDNQVDMDGHNLVFVVGCPRSGTTWLQRSLACHPNIYTGQETKIFYLNIGPQLRHWYDCLDAGKHRGGAGLPSYFTEEEFLHILKSFLNALLQPLTANLRTEDIFLEKTPEHALFIPEILQLLPKSRFIHILRDPRDVVASLLAASRSWASSWAPTHPKQAALMWTYYVSGARQAAVKLSPEQYLEITYEAFHANPEHVLRECGRFLQLPWELTKLKEAIAANTRESALLTNGGTPIFQGGEVAKHSGPKVVEPKGFIRRARPGGWRKELSILDKFWTWKIARHLMRECGYEWPLPI